MPCQQFWNTAYLSSGELEDILLESRVKAMTTLCMLLLRWHFAYSQLDAVEA